MGVPAERAHTHLGQKPFLHFEAVRVAQVRHRIDDQVLNPDLEYTDREIEYVGTFAGDGMSPVSDQVRLRQRPNAGSYR